MSNAVSHVVGEANLVFVIIFLDIVTDEAMAVLRSMYLKMSCVMDLLIRIEIDMKFSLLFCR